MRLALLGDHPDALALAHALVATGRHQLVVVSGQALEPTETRIPLPPAPRRVSDLEEILAEPAVELILVGGPPAVRPAQLRRALQSERPVLCVHPADEKPDAAYEAAMIQVDTRQTLMPILVEAMHPAITRLSEFIDREGGHSLVGSFRLLQLERQARREVLESLDTGLRPSIPGWDVLRRLGGELAEVAAFTDGSELTAGQPVLLHGRFEKGGLFQVALLPSQPASWWRLVVVGASGQAELVFPQGMEGPAFLGYRGADGESREESWPRWDPWPRFVEAFEAALAGSADVAPTWQDEVRALELDDAARSSVSRARVERLEYQEASEEVGFKGTMALTGCALLWAVLLLLIASAWRPWLGWLILPLLLVFIALQLLRYALPGKDDSRAR